MLREEWLVNFRMLKEDFINLEHILRPYIRPSQHSLSWRYHKHLQEFGYDPLLHNTLYHLPLSDVDVGPVKSAPCWTLGPLVVSFFVISN